MNQSGLVLFSAVSAVTLWLAVLAAQPALAQDVSSQASLPSLELIFELDLEVEGEIAPYVEAEQAFDRSFSMSRDLVAQGEGRLTGPQLEGSFRWSLLARKHLEQPFTRVHLTGWLETEDGAEMFLRATGYARDDDAIISPSTTFSMTGEFEVELEPDYEWLNGILVLIDGRFDSTTQTFQYRAWVTDSLLQRPAPTD